MVFNKKNYVDEKKKKEYEKEEKNNFENERNNKEFIDINKLYLNKFRDNKDKRIFKMTIISMKKKNLKV